MRTTLFKEFTVKGAETQGWSPVWLLWEEGDTTERDAHWSVLSGWEMESQPRGGATLGDKLDSRKLLEVGGWVRTFT